MTKPTLNFEIKEKPEKTIIILSPCRSGSSALLNAFAMSGVQSIYQPVKAALRRSVAGDTTPVIIESQTPCVVIKETLGPYSAAEVHYDPLQALIDRGIDPQTMHVVALMRRPEECLDSWIRTFKKEDLDLSVFGAAYTATLDACIAAQAQGVHVIPMRYEELASPRALPALMRQLDIPFSEEMVDWKKSGKYQAGAFAFEYIAQPSHDDFCLEGVRTSSSLEARMPSPLPTVVIPDEIAVTAEIAVAREAYETGLDYLSPESPTYVAGSFGTKELKIA